MARGITAIYGQNSCLQDAFSRFEEEGDLQSRNGSELPSQYSGERGSEAPMELFKRFRGREPQIDALLRHAGIAA
ncbi:M3 family metallopeptidase [Vibrio sp. PP-XX7]